MDQPVGIGLIVFAIIMLIVFTVANKADKD